MSHKSIYSQNNVHPYYTTSSYKAACSYSFRKNGRNHLNLPKKKTRVDLNMKRLFCGFYLMLKSVKHKFFSNFKFSKNKSHSAIKNKQIFHELIFTTNFYINCYNEMKQSLHKTSTMHQKSFSCQHKKETTFLIIKNQDGKLSK